MRLDQRATVAVVGGGFSGLLTALHLLADPDGPRVRLIERRACFARGAAYSTTSAEHLLNVRAANMSAFPDDAGHFQRWLAERREGETTESEPGGFVTRGLYGAYLQGLLRTAAETTQAGRLILDADEATALRSEGEGWRLTMGVGREHVVDGVVLAVGNLPPPPAAGFTAEALAHPAHHPDPWGLEVEDLPETGMALLLGTGLTMIDVALRLARDRPGLKLLALSRRGLLPRRHLIEGPAAPARAAPQADTVRVLLRELRRQARTQDWRAVVDAMRPHVQQVWRGWSQAERARFLRHARPWWDVHRHRLSPRVAAKLDHLTAAGVLATAAGRLVEVRAAGEALEAVWTPRFSRESRSLPVVAAINCTGPNGDLAQARDGLVSAMARDGLIRADACRLGLEVDASGRLIARDGRANPGLYAVGPMTRGAVWEMTSAPDIRIQAAACAREVCKALAFA